MSNNPSPTLAALLSFIFPGLGQIYAGDLRKGVIWALPMLLIIVGGLFLLLGGTNAITALLTAQKTLALIIFNLAFFLYHVAATIDAYDVARRERTFGYTRSARSAPLGLALLISLAIVIHGLPGMYALSYYQFASGFQGGTGIITGATFAPQTLPPQTPTPSSDPSTTPAVSPSPSASQTPGGTSTATSTPSSTNSTGSGNPKPTVKPKECPAAPDLSAWAPGADGRVNILLVGSDSRSDEGASDNSLRTDSMLLLSVNIADCKAALFSFPRNMAEVTDPALSRYPAWLRLPLENGSNYPGYLFGLWRDAAASPQSYPGSDGIGAECQVQFNCERGWRALNYTIEQMSGVPIDGIIAINLKGFVNIVANLPGGGVWLDIPEPLFDDAYYNSQQQLYKVDFKPGCQFLNAEDTLAYARSRHQDSDYQRERRQQFVLQSIRKQLDPLGLLPHIPGLLDAAQQNLFMTFSSDDFPYLAQVASRVDADRLYQYDFAPAHITPLGSMQGMQAKIQNIFSEEEPEPEPNQAGKNCPPKD